MDPERMMILWEPRDSGWPEVLAHTLGLTEVMQADVDVAPDSTDTAHVGCGAR